MTNAIIGTTTALLFALSNIYAASLIEDQRKKNNAIASIFSVFSIMAFMIVIQYALT